MFGLLIDLVVGALSGWIATNLMKLDSSNMVLNCILGICGGIVFGIIAGLFGITTSNMIGRIIFSVIGACLLVFLYNKYIKK